jgi:HD-like signal output (HDOD) protein
MRRTIWGLCMTHRILFVDDEQSVLDGLRRMLFAMRREWHMAFATSGQEALGFLEAAPYDVVVSDAMMPGMDGATLLGIVAEKYPKTLRFMLSGHAEQAVVVRAAGFSHQYLAKPCDPEVLRTRLKAVLALKGLVGSEVVREVVSRAQKLPTLPVLFQRIQAAMADESKSIADIGRLVSQEMSMSAQVLRIVNSSYFALARRIVDPAEAVSYLGAEALRALIVARHLCEQLDLNGPRAKERQRLWDHSMRVAAKARALAVAIHAPRSCGDVAFTAGLLHDLGAVLLPGDVACDGGDDDEAPRSSVGRHRAAAGAYLLGIWGLPEALVSTVAYYHTPLLAGPNAELSAAIVNRANSMDHHEHPELGPSDSVLDEELLMRFGLADVTAL